jgi:hypothetical protein
VRYGLVSRSAGEEGRSEDRGMAAVSVSEGRTHVKNSQLRSDRIHAVEFTLRGLRYGRSPDQFTTAVEPHRAVFLAPALWFFLGWGGYGMPLI